MQDKAKLSTAELNEIISKGDIALFLGNGFSISFDDQFKYKDLMKRIERDWYPDNLIQEILEVKHKLSQVKTSFEALWLDLQRLFNKDLTNRLASPILDIHKNLLSQNKINATTTKLTEYGQWIQYFDNIFTTNYDLLLHWMIQSIGELDKKYKDGIQNKKSQNVFYLHGALHLYYLYSDNHKNGWDVPYRRVSDPDKLKMIDNIQKEKNKLDKHGFFEVLGGTYQEKDYYVNRSQYLHACREKLKESLNSSLIIYGSSLEENDRHLWDIIKYHKNIKKIYISAHGTAHGLMNTAKKMLLLSDVERTALSKEELNCPNMKKTPPKELFFFDSNILSSNTLNP